MRSNRTWHFYLHFKVLYIKLDGPNVLKHVAYTEITLVSDVIWVFVYWILETQQGVLPQVNFLLTHFREWGFPGALPADSVSICCLDFSLSLSHYFSFLLLSFFSISFLVFLFYVTFWGFNSKLVFLLRGILLQCMSSSLLFTQFKDKNSCKWK